MVEPEVSILSKGFKLVKEVKIPRLIPANTGQLPMTSFLSSRKSNRCQKRLVGTSRKRVLPCGCWEPPSHP